ncbi:LOW QUALITY PROTEIN: hypothetical protein QTO34_004613 [Cnephaeus nilssonii]|uniref:Rho guanine nucleotide exchange factor 5 n=1 Tax=Cnephaeus nilssonii TaxID=3371016 RepID=A0AA40HQL0_CNENI|nr:LOW QUALITY PROTEIN: hypothetical protein QTO34_004613 [Eptesicus nilssonii]
MRLHEPPPPAPPKKRHIHPSAVERDSHLSAAVPTLRHCSYPPLALSSGLCGPPKFHFLKFLTPMWQGNTDLCPLLQTTPTIPKDLPASTPLPVTNPLTEPPPLPPKARGRNKSIQGALTNSGGQAKPRPVGQEWAVSSPHSGGRTSWPPAMGRSTDSLASTSRRKSEISPDIAFSNMTSLPSPSSPTTPWTMGLQEPTSEPGLSEESEAPAKGSLRRTDPQEGANGLRRSDVEQGRLKKPSHPHLEKASSWPHRRDPGRPPQGSGGQAAISGEAPLSTRAGIGKACADLPSYLKALQIQEAQPQKSLLALQTPLFFEKAKGGDGRLFKTLLKAHQLLPVALPGVQRCGSEQGDSEPAAAGQLGRGLWARLPRQPRKVLVSSESYLQRLSMASRSSLWQEIPVVRNSTVLLSMTHEDQKLQEAKFELIVSEASYLRSLNIAVDHFQHSAQLRAILSNQDQQWLFSRLQDVRDVSATFLSDLEENFENNIFTFHVCDVVLNHASHFRRVYLPYVTNQTYQERTFQTLLSTNSSFREVLEKLESDPVCQRLSLKSFLILPFQRITRLKLLLQNILKRTQPGSSEEAEATKAHHALEELIRDCNNNVQRMRRTEELIYLSQKIEFECKIFPLISQSRWLVKSGELAALESSVSPGLRRKLNTRPVHLHLFNDCLLLSRPESQGGRFLVFDHAPFSSIRGEKCEMKLHGPHKNLFRLFLLHNTQGTQAEFLFSTETQSEKLRWISALAMPREELDLQECYDSPQVQCLRAYKPRENDELALEKADVVMVTQQSSDGWLEGMRLSDGERGWFPVQQVEFISNPEVRARNLKEAQRVKTAKLQLVEQQT